MTFSRADLVSIGLTAVALLAALTNLDQIGLGRGLLHQDSKSVALASTASVTALEIAQEVDRLTHAVPELKLIEMAANRLGIEVSLAGGSAMELIQYSEAALRNRQDPRFAGRFDDDFTSIYTFRSDFRLQLRANGDERRIRRLRSWLARRLDHAKIDVRSQSADLDSEGTSIGDLRISLRNQTPPMAIETAMNPLIEATKPLPATRSAKEQAEFALDALLHASQFKKRLSPSLERFVKQAVAGYRPHLDVIQIEFHTPSLGPPTPFDLKLINVFLLAADLSYTHSLMRSVDPDRTWSVNPAVKSVYEREPLSESAPQISSDRPKVTGLTARDHGLTTLNHVAGSRDIYASMTRSLEGKPAAILSGLGGAHSVAQRGVGVYTAPGLSPWQANYTLSNYMAVFEMNPDAKEGVDFHRYGDSEVMILRRSAVRVVHNEPKMTPIEAFEALRKGHLYDPDYYRALRQEWRITAQLARDPDARRTVDLYLREVLGSEKPYPKELLSVYLRLPPTPESVATLEGIAAALAPRLLKIHILDTPGMDLLSAILASRHADLLKDFVKQYLAIPRVSSSGKHVTYYNTNTQPFVTSTILNEPWFVQAVSEMPYRDLFIQEIERRKPHSRLGERVVAHLSQRRSQCLLIFGN